MKKFSLLALALVLSGCVSTFNKAGWGGLYSNVTEAVAVGDAKPVKTGKACATSVLFLFATGDGSIEAAKRNGGITKVATVDVENFSAFLFAKSCTVVKGE